MSVPDRWSGILLGAVVALGGHPALGQQAVWAGDPRIKWEIEDTHAGWCVHFLVDPQTAGQALPPGYRPISAATAQGLHPAIQRAIEQEPQYASWVPSALCSYYFKSVLANGRRVSDEKPGDVPALAWWGVLASEGPEPGARVVYALRLFGCNSWKIRKPAASAMLDLEEVDMLAAKVPGAAEDHYRLKIGKTVLLFDGHPAADSTLQEAPVDQSWVFSPSRGAPVWRVSAVLHPTMTRALVGALRIEGKDDLATALRTSPIRLVGPIYSGGTGQILFFR